MALVDGKIEVRNLLESIAYKNDTSIEFVDCFEDLIRCFGDIFAKVEEKDKTPLVNTFIECREKGDFYKFLELANKSVKFNRSNSDSRDFKLQKYNKEWNFMDEVLLQDSIHKEFKEKNLSLLKPCLRFMKRHFYCDQIDEYNRSKEKRENKELDNEPQLQSVYTSNWSMKKMQKYFTYMQERTENKKNNLSMNANFSLIYEYSRTFNWYNNNLDKIKASNEIIPMFFTRNGEPRKNNIEKLTRILGKGAVEQFLKKVDKLKDRSTIILKHKNISKKALFDSKSDPLDYSIDQLKIKVDFVNVLSSYTLIRDIERGLNTNYSSNLPDNPMLTQPEKFMLDKITTRESLCNESTYIAIITRELDKHTNELTSEDRQTLISKLVFKLRDEGAFSYSEEELEEYCKNFFSKKLDNTKKLLDSIEQEYNKTNELVQNMLNNIKVYESKLQVSNNTKNEYIQKLNMIQNNLINLNSKIVEKEQEYRKLSKLYNTNKVADEEIQIKINILSSDIKMLNEQVEEEKEEYETLILQKANLLQERNSIQEQNDVITQEIIDLNNQIASLSNELSQGKIDKNLLSSRLTDIKIKLNGVLDEISHNQKTVEMYYKEFVEKNNINDTISMDVDELGVVLKDLEKEINTNKTKATKLQKEMFSKIMGVLNIEDISKTSLRDKFILVAQYFILDKYSKSENVEEIAHVSSRGNDEFFVCRGKDGNLIYVRLDLSAGNLSTEDIKCELVSKEELIKKIPSFKSKLKEENLQFCRNESPVQESEQGREQ